MKLDKPYLVSTVLPACHAVAHSSLADAERTAAILSKDASRADVYDCSASPVGKLVATFVQGKRAEGAVI